jgi:Flp pilus assembly protein TadG
MNLATNSRRGQALLMMSFAITAMFGIMALVVDVGWANYRKQAAQAAADSAATAAVRSAIARGLNTCGDQLGCYPTTPYTCPATPPAISTTNIDSACMMAATNGFTTSGNQAVNVYANLGNPPSVNGAMSAYWVTVIVTETSASFFGPMVGGRLNPAARATAVQVPGPPGPPPKPWVVAMVE